MAARGRAPARRLMVVVEANLKKNKGGRVHLRVSPRPFIMLADMKDNVAYCCYNVLRSTQILLAMMSLFILRLYLT